MEPEYGEWDKRCDVAVDRQGGVDSSHSAGAHSDPRLLGVTRTNGGARHTLDREPIFPIS